MVLNMVNPIGANGQPRWPTRENLWGALKFSTNKKENHKNIGQTLKQQRGEEDVINIAKRRIQSSKENQ